MPQPVFVQCNGQTVEFLGDDETDEVDQMPGQWLLIDFPVGMVGQCYTCSKVVSYTVSDCGYYVYCSPKCEERYLSGN
jgi:hypothetical protein